MTQVRALGGQATRLCSESSSVLKSMRTDSRGGKPALPFALQHSPLAKPGLLTPFLSVPRLHQNPQILLKAILFCSSVGQNRGGNANKNEAEFL